MPAHLPLLVPLVLVAGLLVGCSASDDDSASTAASGSAQGSALSPAQGLADPAEVGQDVQGRALAVPRAVVRTASLDVAVDDARAAADRAASLALASGGSLEAEDSDGSATRLRLRVPPDRLPTFLDQLAGLGRETGRTVGSEDVTEQVVDLDSRLSTQRASVARVRALLDRATGIGDVVALEGELSRREADLESLTARLRAVEGAADLATVTVVLQAVSAGPGQDDEGFLAGLSAGWEAFVDSARVLATVAGALLPFVPVALLGLLLARRLLTRRVRHPAPTPAT